MSYGKDMVIESFFDSKDIPADQIGGWLIRGHDSRDEYQEFVVLEWTKESWDRVEGWIDWYRTPIEKGSSLLIGVTS